jgi:flagella basal body P-ring formation protein FlgA
MIRMRSFASVLALLAGLADVVGAQQVGTQLVDGQTAHQPPARATGGTTAAAAASPAIPASLAHQVTGTIARQWNEDSTQLQLEWGRVPSTATFPATTDIHLVGRGDGGWFVVVFTPGAASPFAVRVRAGAPDSVLLAARTIEAGRPLAAEDLHPLPRIRWGPPADPTTARIGVGWVTRHALMAGTEVTDGSVMPPPLVHVGDPVRLEWRRGAVLITLDGTSLDAGGAGQTVRVHVGQNRGAKSGTVLATGTVRLDS